VRAPRTGFVLFFALVALSARARGQKAPEEADTKAAPETTPPAAAKAEGDDESTPEVGKAPPDDGGDEDAPRKKKDTAAEPPPPPPKTSEAPLPPPAPPHSDEQTPRPYFVDASPVGRQRHAEIGPDFGIWSRPAKGDSVSYAPAVAWGVHVRAELWKYLGVTTYFSRARHPVDVPRGGLGLADTSIDQEPLDVLQLGARLQPTIMPMSTLRLWLGIGAAWGHVSAEEPTTTGPNSVEYADRTGAYLEYSLAVGATWDVVPEWMAISLMASGGVLSNQSGDVFTDHQAISPSGTTTTIGALPEFESSLTAQLGIGMIL